MDEVAVLVYRAKIAEQTERFDEMAEHLRHVVLLKADALSVEERNLLSVAYKHAVSGFREIFSCFFFGAWSLVHIRFFEVVNFFSVVLCLMMNGRIWC